MFMLSVFMIFRFFTLFFFLQPTGSHVEAVAVVFPAVVDTLAPGVVIAVAAAAVITLDAATAVAVGVGAAANSADDSNLYKPTISRDKLENFLPLHPKLPLSSSSFSRSVSAPSPRAP